MSGVISTIITTAITTEHMLRDGADRPLLALHRGLAHNEPHAPPACPNEEMIMKKTIAAALAVMLSLASLNVLACSGEKAKDGKGEMSTPAKPKA